MSEVRRKSAFSRVCNRIAIIFCGRHQKLDLKLCPDEQMGYQKEVFMWLALGVAATYVEQLFSYSGLFYLLGVLLPGRAFNALDNRLQLGKTAALVLPWLLEGARLGMPFYPSQQSMQASAPLELAFANMASWFSGALVGYFLQNPAKRFYAFVQKRIPRFKVVVRVSIPQFNPSRLKIGASA